jgi:hypothetical protein
MRKGKDPRIRTSDYWIRIREAQKHADPADPDPQHCFVDLPFYRQVLYLQKRQARAGLDFE